MKGGTRGNERERKRVRKGGGKKRVSPRSKREADVIGQYLQGGSKKSSAKIFSRACASGSPVASRSRFFLLSISRPTFTRGPKSNRGEKSKRGRSRSWRSGSVTRRDVTRRDAAILDETARQKTSRQRKATKNGAKQKHGGARRRAQVGDPQVSCHLRVVRRFSRRPTYPG